jgi:predicted transcriptional regulator/transcriptional regulator with XRE-family HTH domain
MAHGKLFIGLKVRELRLASHQTQSQFAQRIGISTSYLNQIENNQRPVSATVLLQLADKFNLDISELSRGETDRLLSAVTEALSDPLFESFTPSAQELKLISQNAPSLAHALVLAHQAYRRKSEQLADVDHNLENAAGIGATPYEEVRDFFHFVDNYVHELDVKAEALAAGLYKAGSDRRAALVTYVQDRFGVSVAFEGSAGSALRQFDRTRKLLILNPLSQKSTQVFQLAYQISQLHAGADVDEIAQRAGFATEEATDICRIGLHNYFAGALVMPYGDFLGAAGLLRHDIELLSARFEASLEQVCHRLSTLQRPGNKGVPIFFARIDRAGNITKRHSATKLQFARFGAACPLWNAHRAFETPHGIIRQLAETPDGVRYLCLATQTFKGMGGFAAARTGYVLAFGCEISYADQFVYADDLQIGERSHFDPIGISCRLCERKNCSSRAIPPLRGRLSIDQDLRETVPYRLT